MEGSEFSICLFEQAVGEKIMYKPPEKTKKVKSAAVSEAEAEGDAAEDAGGDEGGEEGAEGGEDGGDDDGGDAGAEKPGTCVWVFEKL